MKVCDEWCGNKTSFVPKEIFKGINKKTQKLLHMEKLNPCKTDSILTYLT